MTDQTDDFFAELDAEIDRAVAKTKLKTDAAALRKKAHNMRLSPQVRQAAAIEFKHIQAIVEAESWEALKCGALFAEQSCDGCGSVHYNFLQFMQEERKIRDHRTRRWIRVDRPAEGLSHQTIIQPLVTHICADCCSDHEFDLQSPDIRLQLRNGALTVSATYTQGDINDPS